MPETIPTLQIQVEYYALFRQCAKKSEETIDLENPMPSGLYDDLRARYRFPLEKHLIHLVVNDVYSPWDKPLQPGDRVTFIPPVSGG